MKKETTSHKGYDIYKNEYYNVAYPSTEYLYHNTNDCDEPIGTGDSIQDCIEQIEEQL